MHMSKMTPVSLYTNQKGWGEILTLITDMRNDRLLRASYNCREQLLGQAILKTFISRFHFWTAVQAA